jgi:hypothetical protein
LKTFNWRKGQIAGSALLFSCVILASFAGVLVVENRQNTATYYRIKHLRIRIERFEKLIQEHEAGKTCQICIDNER